MSLRSRRLSHILGNTCAWYGANVLSTEKLRAWVEYVVFLSKNFGSPFDEGACTPGNTKYVLFRNFNRTFEKNVSNIKSIELRKLDQSIENESISASLYNKDGNGIFFAYDQLISYNYFCVEISRKLCEILKPKYLTCYKWPLVFSPVFSFFGTRTSDFEIDEWSKFYNKKHVDICKRIVMWDRSKNELLKLGYLREIYPLNFINGAHLNHEVFPKITLKNWVEAADHRGTIAKATDELWLWSVPDEDLESITKELALSDILLCVSKDNPQRYDYGVRPEDQITLI
ncbi:MAG: hypothetical protein LBB25_00660 [Holosporaceae bacterium]|jgi:hypothetical protein|nr:hypothetical protein [Holosporaceae bacterium]